MTTIDPATSTAAATASAPTNAQQQLSANFDTFLTLLTTQLKNQDPLNPTDSNQFTQQLVEFSQVEQQINTNDNLKTLINQGTNQTGAYAVSYLGKTVTVANGNAPLANGKASWNYDLGNRAAQTTLTVTDVNGNAVFTTTGETGAGSHTLDWNGVDNNGAQLPDGTYTLHVAATAADGSTIPNVVSTKGAVTEIDLTSGTPTLMIGPMPIKLSDVAGVSSI